MKQKNKELLLKDLTARLNTNLVCSIYRTDDEGVGYRDEILHGYCKGDIWYEFYFREDCSICMHEVSKIKPYLFPLSSMTDELWDKEFRGLGIPESTRDSFKYGCETLEFDNNSTDFSSIVKFINQLIKHHFDIYGLIPMGLAIDATNLKIYDR